MKSIRVVLGGLAGWFLLACKGGVRQVSADGERFCSPVLGSEAIKNSVFFLLHSPT